MFGFKLIRTQTLNDIIASNYAALETIEQRDQSIREMADEIREMDQMIYRMTQCASWETMRPIFNNLQSKQQVRQVEESKRIGNIVRKELISVYSKP